MEAFVQSDARRRVRIWRCRKGMMRLQRCLYGLHLGTTEIRVYSCDPKEYS
jgi:hypothetical protein